jgi:hypothetical protein
MTAPSFRPSRSRRALTVLVVVLAVALLIHGGRRGYRAWAAHRAVVARGSLYRCLLGEQLAVGERASGRIRRIVLAGGARGWPERCNHYGTELQIALRDAGKEDRAAYVGTTVGVTALDAEKVTRWPYDIDAFFQDGPATPAPSEVPAAPTASALPDDRSSPLISRGSLIGARADPAGGSELRLLVGGDAGKHVCLFAPALTSARCQALRAPASEHAEDLMSSEDGAPALVSERVYGFGAKQIYRSDGWKRIGNPTLESEALARSDGTVTLVERDSAHGRFAYFAEQDGPHAKSGRSDLGWTLPPSVSPVLLADRMLWLESSSDKPHLMLRRVLADATVGPIEDAGALALDRAGLRACRTEHALAILASGQDDHAVTFRSETGGTPLVRFEFPEQAGSRDVAGSEVYACGRDDASLAMVRAHWRRRTEFDSHAMTVHAARCTATNCKVWLLEIDDMLAGSSNADRPDGIGDTDVIAGMLDDRLLVVWRSEMHGIRFRLAPPDAISRAKERVLYDDRVEDGQAFRTSLVHPMLRLFIRRGVAVLLFQTMLRNEGVKAIRIAPDGSTTLISG